MAPDRLDLAIQRAQQNLLRLQHDEGYWCGELVVDSTLCSDYILFMHWAEELDPVLPELILDAPELEIDAPEG